jgi:hypothetical protein
MASQEYKLDGRFQYGVYISKFDGWDYKFPIVDPIRSGKIEKMRKSESLPYAVNGQWLDVEIVPKQKKGYFSWVPTDDFILHMRSQHSLPKDPYAQVGRFSYEPESGEFLMGRLDQKHAATIDQFGSHGFNRYVRGIYIRDRKLILIRAYFDPLDENGKYDDNREFDPGLDQQKTDKTLEMLIKNNLPSDAGIITRVDNEAVKKFDIIFI